MNYEAFCNVQSEIRNRRKLSMNPVSYMFSFCTKVLTLSILYPIFGMSSTSVFWRSFLYTICITLVGSRFYLYLIESNTFCYSYKPEFIIGSFGAVFWSLYGCFRNELADKYKVICNEYNTARESILECRKNEEKDAFCCKNRLFLDFGEDCRLFNLDRHPSFRTTFEHAMCIIFDEYSNQNKNHDHLYKRYPFLSDSILGIAFIDFQKVYNSKDSY